MRPAPFTFSRGFLAALAILLALLHAVLALTATTEKSMTADEIAHLVAGHVYNVRGDYRLQPENGNLTQRWEALPLTLAHAPLPPVSQPTWQRADVWGYGHAFFYEQGLSADEFVFLGRAMIALVSAATGLLIFFWSRQFFGWKGAFLSLALYAFCPAFLAHGALATSDAIMVFFFLASLWSWWRLLESPGPGRAALSGVVFGLSCVVKFSAVLLLPMFALCALVWFLGRPPAAGLRAPLLRLVRLALVHAGVAWLIIWLCYGFRFSAFAPALAEGGRFYRGDWNWILTDLGWQRSVIVLLRDWHALPEAFLYGFAFVLQFARERAAFLNGEYRTTGWITFFPYAFLVKTTLPLLGLIAVGAIRGAQLAWQQGKSRTLRLLRPFTPLIVLFVVYGVSSLTIHLNIGHRHILPLYPVLFIWAGAFGGWFTTRPRLPAVFVAVLLLWHMGTSWKIRPHYLAYFNSIAGGPENGYRHLVDSSLDWGQDLPGLKTWLDRHARGETVYLSYFGSGEPDYEGIRAQRLPFIGGFKPVLPWIRLGPGVYCIGATMLQHVYAAPGLEGSWTPELENEYQRMREFEPAFDAYARDPAQHAEMDRAASPEKWQHALTRHAQLRFARLCHYLRAREPDAEVGYSILIYRLSAPEIAAATTGSLADWRALIDRTSPHGRD